MNKLELKKRELQEKKEKQFKPETRQELNRFEKNEYCLYGLLQLLIDKKVITQMDIEKYCIQGVTIGEEIKPVKQRKENKQEEIIELSPDDEITEETTKSKSKLELAKERIRQKKGEK